MKAPKEIQKHLRKDTDDYVWWKGRRQSKNIIDRRHETPDPMLNTNVVVGPFGGNKSKNTLPDKISVPPSRPKTHNNLITPGKWITK